ncbi:hypothetical protein [Rhodovastum atsumiense]|uniref:hypothetical protein n=1 Tax=Rhodovastum atsumiense TaxID=504468 RepID=UPI00139F2B97|nr:hypothetical protein [Rhodovastum atsumiense]
MTPGPYPFRATRALLPIEPEDRARRAAGRRPTLPCAAWPGPTGPVLATVR